MIIQRASMCLSSCMNGPRSRIRTYIGLSPHNPLKVASVPFRVYVEG